MDALEAIRHRRSIRKYQDKPVPEDVVGQLLAAAMMAPSARNAQPWQFVVIDDRALLAEYAAKHPNAAMAKDAPLAILVCGDLRLELSEGYWPVDCAAAVENLLLAAHALGLGAVWTGVYPRQPRMATLRELCSVPDPVVPHSLIVLGYPAEEVASEDRFRPDRVHRNRWG
ncbi:MAG: nitroreductase family protein [Planctomycetota bacterium]|jgi:nitroreductase